ncbi:hypothetical protein HNY73_020638 [Argiope bruennichi]|uniref:Uncharacterized protein n=1 Tax=Argiope bruennichi TaxID=94029 RepID=A0A8T0EA44_ARGBR|nr:hypothetical protein HNY73_020638 [Argiope bruennichi]
MSLYHALIFSLMAIASICCMVEALRFGRNEMRCSALCMDKDSDDCKTCQNRTPMRFGKRSEDLSSPVGYLYELERKAKPEFRILALIKEREFDSSYSDEK